jgi:hypothetical protein
MATGIDILHLFPELVAIGQRQLQECCDDWLRRPIASEYAVAQIAVDDNLLLHISLSAAGSVLSGDRAFIPIDELLGYIVDRQFPDASQRRELHNVKPALARFNLRYERRVDPKVFCYLQLR